MLLMLFLTQSLFFVSFTDARKSHLIMSGFSMDKPGLFDNVEAVTDRILYRAAVAQSGSTPAVAEQKAEPFKHSNEGFMMRCLHNFDDVNGTTKVVPYMFPGT